MMTLRQQMVYGPAPDYIAHHGILGQKWGVRRFQNKDGSLTSEGKKHLKQEFRLAEDKLRNAHKKINERYEANKLKLVDEHFNAKTREDKKRNRLDQEKNEKNMAIAHYKAIKEFANARVNLQRELHGENSLRYKLAKKQADRAVERYGDYTITKDKDGHYRVDYQHLEGYQNSKGHFVSSSTYRQNIGDASAASGRNRQALNEFAWNRYLNRA